jgi:hypothetical protein
VPTYYNYVARHGEFGAQALVEQIERIAGIRINLEAPAPLEERWNAVMARPLPQTDRAR